jgi:hypothetical protein
MNNISKRIGLAKGMGLLAGLLCAYGASTQGVIGAFDYHSAMFWTIVLNRGILGMIIGVVGVYTLHPYLRFKIGPVLRGIVFGATISLLMATGILIAGEPDRWIGFWYTIGAGIVIGVVIDLVVTKLYGQGRELHKQIV